MNILFFKNGLDAVDGSAEHLVNYAVWLRRAGHGTSVLIANPTSRQNQYLRRLQEEGVDVRYVGHTGAALRLRCRRALWKLTGHGPMISGLLNWRNLVEIALVRIFREARPDVVHVFVDPAAAVGLRAAVEAAVPALCHEVVSPRSSPDTYSYYDELAEILPHCPAVVAQSPRMVQECQTRIPFGGRVVVIPNIVEDPGEPPSASSISEEGGGGEVVFGFAARLEPRKAPLMLLDAFGEAFKHDRRLRLRMAGDGPMRSQVLARAIQLGIIDRCEFPGAYEGKCQREAYFQAIQVVVQPSLAEGIPNTVMEGMARAKAIISTAVGGIADVLSQESAVLIQPGDVAALARAMIRLAGDGQLRSKLGQAARTAYLRMFSPVVVLPMLVAEYERVRGEAAVQVGDRCEAGRGFRRICPEDFPEP
jgi:glycosyltransferase involved in cell wall biosynthesis